MALSSQAVFGSVIVSMVIVLSFLPTMSYEEVSLRKRILYAVMALFAALLILYTTNCMLTTEVCWAWSWVFIFTTLFLPAILAMFYILAYDWTRDTMVSLQEKWNR